MLRSGLSADTGDLGCAPIIRLIPGSHLTGDCKTWHVPYSYFTRFFFRYHGYTERSPTTSLN